MKKLSILFSTFLFFTLTACSFPNDNEPSESDEVELIISAAASLTDVAEELKEKFNEKYPQIQIHYNFGGSGKLAQQIIRGGAPVDIFMSASKEDMDFLAENQLILEESKIDFAKNEIVLITHVSNDIQIEDLEDITKLNIDYIAVGDIDSVPVGRYAKQAFDALHLWEQMEEKVVYSNSVNHVLSYVEQRNADIGIVFATDALRGENIKVAAKIDPRLHEEIIYPAAVVNTSESLDAAELYLDFLRSEEGSNILQSHGFITE